MSQVIRKMQIAERAAQLASRVRILPPQLSENEAEHPDQGLDLERIPQLLERSSQCFACSRIYYGEILARCPRCGSDSLACYTIDELRSLGRGAATGISAAAPPGLLAGL